MFRWIQSIPLLILLFNIHCSVDSISGTTSSENAKVIGTILDDNEIPVDSAEVRLRNHKDSTSTMEYDTTVYSNAEGVYAFNLPPIGDYYITAAKAEKRIAYIDSVAVLDTQKVPVPTYTIGEQGSITCVVVLSDSVNITEKVIVVVCEPLDYEQEIRSRDSFSITDIPRGRYPLIFTPVSDLHQIKRIWFFLEAGETKELGTVTLLPKGYFTEEELKRLAESMAVDAGKDVQDVFRILEEEGELFSKLWKYEQEEDVRRIIASAVEKAIDSN